MKSEPWLHIKVTENPSETLRLGTSLSRRLGNAVLRNKLRRWSREILRALHTEGLIRSCDIHLVFKEDRVKKAPQGKPGFFEKLKYQELREILQNALK